MNRRDFIALQGALICSGMPAFAGRNGEDALAAPKLDRSGVRPRNRRPYGGVDWKNALQLNGTTHIHQHLDVLDVIKERKLEFVTISNYYPSSPVCPLSESRYPRGLPVSDWPVMHKGRRVKGPFDWNKIVSAWADELPPESRKLLPFRNQSSFYRKGEVPDWILEAPNAEHFGFSLEDGRGAGGLHMCAPGSAFSSGTFDARNRMKTHSHGWCMGSGEFWGTAVDRMIEALVCPDGGGVTVNHPTWTKLDRGLLLDILDWDPRVLGIEILESGTSSENYWDWVLSTGRQCFGFCVPDHSLHKRDFGVSVLVVPERTAEACLRAYRNGNFYGAAHGLGELRFTSIVFDGKRLCATTDKPAKFEVITARGVRKTSEGMSVEWVCPDDDSDRNGPAVEVYARIRATALDGCGERLFSQACMLA